jgi:hypothetical protein
MLGRQRVERETSPSALVADTQSVKTTGIGSSVVWRAGQHPGRNPY